MTPDEANAAAELQPGETVDARVRRLFAGMSDGSLAATGLTRLDLSGCAIDRLPDEIATCASLEFLSLGKNPLSTLPETFHRLVNLRILFFLGCHFTEVPRVIGRLPSLYMLSFKANRLESVPEGSIPKSVCWLILSDNNLTKLPRCVGECVGMRKLLLAGNQLTNEGLPNTMSSMRDLELVRLADNKLDTVPEWLLTHPKLAWIALAANPCTDPFASEARRRAASDDESFDVPEVTWESLEVSENAPALGKGASGEVFASLRGGVGNGRAAVKVYSHAAKTSDGRPEDEMAASVLASRTGCTSIVRTLARFTRTKREEASIAGIASESIIASGENLPRSSPGGLVMEYLDPKQWVNLGGPPSFESVTRDCYEEGTTRTCAEIVALARCISGAGAARHRAGVHHGDLYAHNVLFRGEADGEGSTSPAAKLSDFGAAFFYAPGSEVGAELERNEVRAFGVLLEEALGQHDGDVTEHDGLGIAQLAEIAERCVGEREGRPSFAAIASKVGVPSKL